MNAMNLKHELRVLNWPFAWQPSGGKGMESREEKRRTIMARHKRSLDKSKAGQHIAQPDDLVHDPRYGMKVSRQGKDLGAVKRALKDEQVDVDEKKQSVKVVKDGLDRMLENGTIDEAQEKAARMFQKEFGLCGYGHCASINLEGVSDCSGGGVEDVYARSSRSRDYVYHVFRLLGGPESNMSRAVFWYIGMNKNFSQVTKIEGDSNNAWRTTLICALQLMGDDYKNMCRGKRRKANYSGFCVHGLKVSC